MKIVNPYKFISRLFILLLLVGAIYIYIPRQEPLIELPEPMTTATVTVNAGDTLWTLAEKLSPDSPRETIYTIKKLNALKDDLIYPGQTLVIPAEGANLTAHE